MVSRPRFSWYGSNRVAPRQHNRDLFLPHTLPITTSQGSGIEEPEYPWFTCTRRNCDAYVAMTPVAESGRLTL